MLTTSGLLKQVEAYGKGRKNRIDGSRGSGLFYFSLGVGSSREESCRQDGRSVETHDGQRLNKSIRGSKYNYGLIQV